MHVRLYVHMYEQNCPFSSDETLFSGYMEDCDALLIWIDLIDPYIKELYE